MCEGQRYIMPALASCLLARTLSTVVCRRSAPHCIEYAKLILWGQVGVGGVASPFPSNTQLHRHGPGRSSTLTTRST